MLAKSAWMKIISLQLKSQQPCRAPRIKCSARSSVEFKTQSSLFRHGGLQPAKSEPRRRRTMELWRADGKVISTEADFYCFPGLVSTMRSPWRNVPEWKPGQSTWPVCLDSHAFNFYISSNVKTSGLSFLGVSLLKDQDLCQTHWWRWIWRNQRSKKERENWVPGPGGVGTENFNQRGSVSGFTVWRGFVISVHGSFNFQ